MIWSYYIYVCVFTNWKLYNIAAHIDRHVSCLLKNVNIIQFFFYTFLILYYWSYLFFSFLLDIVSIVAKTIKCSFGMSWNFQLICNFSLFLLLFMGLIAFFDTIHEFYYTIQLIFQFLLQFQQKNFSFS